MITVAYGKQDDLKAVRLPCDATVALLAETLALTDPSLALAGSVNDILVDLSHPLKEGDRVDLLRFDDPRGRELFWHTSAHVLAQAVLRLWPDAKPTIGPPIEEGFYYDFADLILSEEDFPKIEEEVKRILAEDFRPVRHEFADRQEALRAFGDNLYKRELIEEFEEGSVITAYGQGEFFDLCRGPHLPRLGKIKAFKLLKTSGAYWRGDSSGPVLTRIYAISFPSKELMKKHLAMLEEAKRRDHRLLGARLNLFSFHPEAPAMPFFHPRGMTIWDALVAFWREIHGREGYEIIKTPQLLTKDLWIVSGHWEHYHEHMFLSYISETKQMAVKPMNCPGCMLYYKTASHSYREFPLRIAELGHVHRRESSGASNGLFRVRAFHQDDAHLFMTPDMIGEEIGTLLRLVRTVYERFGLEYRFELSTRPEKSIGTDRDWEVATAGLKAALDAHGKPYSTNEGDGAFYGPKIDLHVRDVLGRGWQCGTVQLDMALPERFGLEYKDRDGVLKRPVMIHRAVFGSLERFLAILIEHFAGKFPLWMSPEPVRMLPVSDTHLPYAKKVARRIEERGIACTVDDAHESLGKKIRKAQLEQVNYMLTVGDNEVRRETISLRTRNNRVHGEIKLGDFSEVIEREYGERRLASPYEE